MADPPTHFFKFIHPSFKFNPSIPSSFLRNLNCGRCFKVTLRRGRHEWSVNIDDGIFGGGWRRFMRENGVQEFDFIVFKHQGSMVFDFLVFDQSTCEKQYPNLFDEMDVEEHLTESGTICTHRPKKLKKRKRKDYAYSQDQENFQVKETDSTIKKATSSTLNNHPYFISTLKPCSFKKSALHIPVKFAVQNGLKIGEMILRDDKGRSWKVQLNKKQEKHIYIGRGLRAFRVANGLKKGDAFKFELIENENDDPPIVNFSLLKSKPINTDRKAKLEQKKLIPYEEDDLPYFMGKLKSWNIRRSRLYLPLKFARLNGLINKKQMILKNFEDGRTWSLEIQNHKKKFYYIGQGWKDFQVANGLKEGDCFKLQVVDKGEMPIANFYLL
ncbi:B3 domain-containing protein REM10 isoform X1 [Lactuca sativa]|uniref:B3 domain-containing protein REM10 isoform X1 n=1 Tax=Lactuca sativa TaxID=4236 RepID=UPI001C68DF87|nr:B3 domain-containing protein REM10 isoform X1 [Lactuca sativa]